MGLNFSKATVKVTRRWSDAFKILQEKQLSIWNSVKCKDRIRCFQTAMTQKLYFLSSVELMLHHSTGVNQGRESYGGFPYGTYWHDSYIPAPCSPLHSSQPRQEQGGWGLGGQRWWESLQGKYREPMAYLCRGRKLPSAL